jgi:putative hydrolase of the HAD superfamily
MRRDRIFRQVLSELGRGVDLEKVHSAYIKVESRWLSVYGNRKLSPEETADAYRDLDAKVFLSLFRSESPEEADKVSRVVRSRWPVLEKSIPPDLYPDAEPTLSWLAEAGFVMALVSNAPPDTVKVVEDLGLRKYIPHIVISGVVGYSKPHPEIFRIALTQAGVKPEQTVHVGDLYESDVVGARNAGIKGILLDREGTATGLDCPIITTLTDLRNLL